MGGDWRWRQSLNSLSASNTEASSMLKESFTGEPAA
jgi:hypothetical protein